MANKPEPMIKLEPGGIAPVLSYNVPEPTSYSGRNFIELQFPENYFNPGVSKKPAESARVSTKNLDPSAIKSAVLTGMKSGFSDPKLFPNIKLATSGLRFVEKPNPGLVPVSSMPVSKKLSMIDADEVTSMMQAGKRLNIYKSMFGTFTYNYIPEPVVARPRVLLVETYRLSSFLGSYGAGRTIKTFSLLPGERTKISVKSYAKRETDAKSASSILDSFTEESSNEFEDSIQSEQSRSSKYEENFEYHAEASAECSWGFGSAKASGGVKGGSNSAREESAKNISSATSKHAAKASAKRDVQINTSYEVKEETGEEMSTEREIQNINVSRTLNFVFRQMNQEFITLLTLVDVRVAFFNGFAESKREVTLPELDTLLEEVLVDDAKRVEVKKSIIDQLQNIVDYKDAVHNFIEEKSFSGTDKYWRIKKNYPNSVYEDSATGTKIEVPGIILSANKHTLRTEGVIVEALLGQGDALDSYSHSLQDEAIRSKELANSLLQNKVQKQQLAIKLVSDGNTSGADIFSKIFPENKEKEKEA
jgi:hypothetical protein